MKFKVLACDIMKRELSAVAPRSPHELDIEFLTRDGHHNNPESNRPALQAALDAVPQGYDAILLGFAYCNCLLKGICARHTRVVVPRAHDCITFFMGSRRAYTDVFTSYPGTYFYTGGWLDRGDTSQIPQTLPSIPGLKERTYAEMVERYGEDNAQYLMETLGGWRKHYRTGALIRLPTEDAAPLRKQVQSICAENSWEFLEVDGSLSLFEKWVSGQWDDDFLVVEPNQCIGPTHDDKVMEAITPDS